MKSLLILNTDPMHFSYGGVCPFMRNMHPYLQEAFHVDYLTLPDGWKKGWSPVRVKYLLYLLLHKKELRKFDFILSHSPEGSYMASFTKTPFAHIYHGNSNPMVVGRFRLGKYFARLYDLMVDRIERKAALLYSVGPTRNKRQKKLYNPVNQNVKPIPYDLRKGFIFAGRLEAVKNIDRLIRIYSKLPIEIRNENSFFIAGYGSLESILKKLVKKLDLDNQIVFLGNIPNVEMLKTDMDKKLLLMASSAEGFPTAIAEAFSVGVPVVSTDVGDISSIVKNGENGLLLPVDFKDEDYLEAIQKILIDYDKFSEHAFNASKVFNAGIISQGIINDIKGFEGCHK